MRAWHRRAVVVLASALLPALAAPAGRLSVGPVVVSAGSPIVRQLEAALCGGGACAPWEQVSTRGQLDARKAAALGVAGVLTGSVTRRGGTPTLGLAFYAGKPAPARTWTLQLEAGERLPEAALQRLQADVAGLLGVPVATLRPPVAAAAPAKAATRPPAATPATTAASAAPPAAIAAPAPAATTATAAAAPSSSSKAAAASPASEPAPPPLFAVEAGVSLVHRSLGYQGAAASSGSLLAVDVPLFAAPALRLEVYPAHRSAGPWRGVGLTASYERSIGLGTQVEGSAASSDTTAARLSAGLLWRAPPLGGWRLTLVPAVTYEHHTVTASPVIQGLPDAQLSGVAASLGLEAPLGGRATLLARAGWVWWSEAADLVAGSPAFFPGRGASALDAEAGVDVAIGGGFSLRGLLAGRWIGYDLAEDPSGTYAATGASDTYLGGRVVLRLER